MDTTQHGKTPSRERPFVKTLDRPPHAQIVDQGPPDGCLPGLKAPCNVFPKLPFVCYDTSGAKAGLSIESDAFWVESDSGEKERIFFSDVREVLFPDIPGYRDQYIALFLQTENGRRAFYYIPHQFMQLIDSVCQS
jgi:hypothetical protein